MEVFGPAWRDYTEKIRKSWQERVMPDDLVLVPGDISWAAKLEDALKDLDWIDQLPGEKLIIRGNHDYWWPSASKLKTALPPSIHFIQNSTFEWNDVSFGGARLWDTFEYSFENVIDFVKNPLAKQKSDEELKLEQQEGERIFLRELERLKLSLEKMKPSAKTRIALTHYPPIGANLRPSRASAILEDYKIETCVFGHLHNVRENSLPFGSARGVHYVFASADYLNFSPIKIFN